MEPPEIKPHQVAQRVNTLVEDGRLPGETCNGCGAKEAELIPLFAVCDRQRERMDPRELKRSLLYLGLMVLGVGVLGNLVDRDREMVLVTLGQVLLLALFAIRLLRGNRKTIVEGENLVVPVPVRSCASCQEAAEEKGGRKLATFGYQFLYALGFAIVFAWWVLDKLNWTWGVAILVLAIFVHLLVTWSRRKSPDGDRALLQAVPEYAQLLGLSKNPEIWSTLPPALESEVPEWARNGARSPVQQAPSAGASR